MNIAGTVTDCVFTNNTAPANRAGAVYCAGGDDEAIITNCEFTDSTCGFEGGALVVETAPATITSCTFTNNEALGDPALLWSRGGAVWCSGGNGLITFDSCTFDGNRADNYGGALYVLSVTGLSGLTSGTLTPSVRERAVVTASDNINTGSTSTDNSVVYDGGLLGVSILTADGPVTDAPTVTYTIEFTTAVENFSQTLLSVVGTGGGTIAGVVEDVAGQSYTVTVTTNGDGTLALVLNDDDTINAAGVPATVLNGAGTGNLYGNAILIDKTPPELVSIERADPLEVLVDSDIEFVVFRITFSDAVTGLLLSDVTSTLPAIPVDDITAAGNRCYAFCYVNGNTGTLGLNVNSGAAIVNLVGQAYADGTPAPNEVYEITEPNAVQTNAKHWTRY